uniref:Auxin response factor n=1 Tax=Rhizophora mucronata TaxID=61149 RepID=A0A2P2J5Y5_RHIMU
MCFSLVMTLGRNLLIMSGTSGYSLHSKCIKWVKKASVALLLSQANNYAGRRGLRTSIGVAATGLFPTKADSLRCKTG